MERCTVVSLLSLQHSAAPRRTAAALCTRKQQQNEECGDAQIACAAARTSASVDLVQRGVIAKA
jgi:hypothetical protein